MNPIKYQRDSTESCGRFSDAGKLPLAGGSMQGDLSMLSHHLYIGEKWRLEAYGGELHFRYSADGMNWGTGRTNSRSY